MIPFRQLAARVVLVVAVLAVGAAASRVTMIRWRIAREAQSLKAEIAALEQQQIELKDFLEKSKNPEALERDARQRLNFSGKDEKVVLLVPGDATQAAYNDNDDDNNNNDDNDDDGGKDGENDKDRDEPNPVKWWRKFFGP